MATAQEDRLGDTPNGGVKPPCVVATTANITLSGEQTIDGVAVVAGNRVLVKDQSTGSEDGIYECSAGAWTRVADWNADNDLLSGMTVPVASGTANGLKIWMITYSGSYTVDSTSITATAI
jgi:phage-related tail fiber protein